MRKLLAFAAAIVIVAGLAFTMFDRQVLSFSEPSNARVTNSMPPNQAQPQDFAGAGSQFYYFGPDFICQIFSDTTISCYGSDAHNVVSNTPSGTGFTNVDGGDTYACAFHQATRFNQCWGSITLSPPTIQPTATPEPTMTPEPTAPPLPPGVTPEPTATSEPTATATPEPPDPCRISMPAGGTLPLTITGSWIDDCVSPVELEDVADGDRYYRYVRFNATGAAGVSETWTATLKSDEDTYMLLWRVIDDTEPWALLDRNDDMVEGNTNSRITWTVTQGETYVIDLTTYTAETLGDFTLTIEFGTGSSQNSTGQQNIRYSDDPNTVPTERRQQP